MMILTIDFGTTVTKVGLWSDEGLVALTRSVVTTSHPQPGWAEQDPLRWWTSVVIACAESRAQAPAAFGRVDVIACSGARQTFVPVSPSGEPIGKGILWSDRRGVAEAPVLAEALGGEDINRARTGIPLDAGAMAAKLAWLHAHQPDRLALSDVILSPRDFVLRRMTDEVVTDASFASRSGLYDFDGNAVRELAGPAMGKLPSVVPVRHRHRPSQAGPGSGARPAPGHTRGHRRRGPPVRGPRVGCLRGHPDGQLGHDGQRLGPGPRASGPVAGRSRGHERGQRRLAARGRALRRRLVPGLARPAARPSRRRAGHPGRQEPARGPRRHGGAVARRRPRALVAR